MFISDEHVLLDILSMPLNYADHPARSMAHLRVIAEAREVCWKYTTITWLGQEALSKGNTNLNTK